MDKEGIQAIIDKIDNETKDGENPVIEEQEKDPQQLDESGKDDDPKETGQGEVDKAQKEGEESDQKASHAFAAMRSRIKELERELETLRESKKQEQKKDESKDPEIKADDKKISEYDKVIEELKSEINDLKNDRLTEKNERKIQETAYQLQSLKTKYNLTNDDLMKFAEDADEAGIDLTDGKFNIERSYQMLYADKILDRQVKSEVAKVLAEMGVSTDKAPETGGKGLKKETPKSMRSIIEKIDRETK